MRLATFIVLQCLIVALLVCAVVSFRSKKPIRYHVTWLLLALLPPMIGNSMLIFSSDWLVSRIGGYLYYIGLDWSVMALLTYTGEYCRLPHKTKIVNAASTFAMFDIIQLLANIFTGHAFDTYAIMVEGRTYWALTPYFGQTIHRVIAYGIFFLSVLVFVSKFIGSPRIYKERYVVILAAMVLVGLWETFYIFSGTPVDLSMIGFGIFGILVFYFSLYYKPYRLLDRMLAGVVSSMDEAVFFFDREGACIYANAAGERIFGIVSEEELHAVMPQIKQVVGKESFDPASDWSCQRTTGSMGNYRHWDISYRTVCDAKGKQVGAYLMARDRSDEEKQLQAERYNATHDRLTQLYNREHLYEVGRELIDRNPDTDWCVMALDIKEFKIINDIFSGVTGDRVLCGLADLIRAHTVDPSVYGRLSGDKFGIVMRMEDIDVDVLEHILSSESGFAGISYPITVHAGLYPVKEPELEISVMFDRAFMAIETIKNELQHHVATYDERMRLDVIWNQKISAELDEAIATGQIRPYLQPMVNDDGKVQGAEVLVRWIHPEEGFLAPYRFIPYFEENGRVAQLDQHMWECACQILRSWEDRGIDLFLSVNISPKDFYFIDVYETISSLVRKYRVRPSKLRLEITETVMMSDVESRLRIISDLRRGGFIVEMDDFGSGYSSLNMLKDMPVDVLKIDMMFLYKTENQRRAQTILQTIVNLSRQLGIPSITEGVETADQLSMLVNMGCHLFQGYYFAKPMPFDEFERTYVDVA